MIQFLPGLDNPLGMEVKTISDGQISATSMESETYRASNARLHLDIGGGGWCADSSLLAEQPQYLQVYFQYSVALTAVATQGINSDSSCVTQYYLSTTFDLINWVYIHDLTGKKVGVNFPCYNYRIYKLVYMYYTIRLWSKLQGHSLL